MRRSFWRLAGVGLLTAALTGAAGRAQQPGPQDPVSAQTPPGQGNTGNPQEPPDQRQRPDPQQPPDQQQPANQQPANQQPTPTFRTGVNFVRVDAIVTDKDGKAVPNLTADDFEVTEQNRPQKIETFRLVSLDGGGAAPGEPPREIRTELDEEREAARDDVRLFGIFLDDYHVRLESSLIARDQIARFVDTQLVPSDMVSVMYPLQPISSLRMTRNHDAIAGAIQQFQGRKYDYRPRNTIEERYQYYPAETVEKIRNQVSMSAIQGLIIHLGGLKEGRKALILVSEGYSNILPPQLRDPNAAQPGIGNPNSQNPLAGQNSITEDRYAAGATFDMELELRELYTTANRYNVSIYTVDPRGLAASEFGIDQNVGQQVDRQYLGASLDTLRTLAGQTDGRAIINRNDLTMGMKQIVQDSSAYYLLGYNSTFTAADGKFHEIKVRLKKPGLQVRARKGYWALNRQEVAAATAPPTPSLPKPIENALTNVTATSRARVIRSWVGTERGAEGKTKVTFVWEPAPKLPGEPSRPGDQPSRVALTAAGMNGDPYFRGRVPSAGASANREVSFEVPPGKLQLRLSVEAEGSEVLDSETREITVPDLSSPQTTLSTPEVYRVRTARELQQLKADAQATPTIAREFARADRLLVRVAAYGPGDSAPQVSAKILSRTGQAMTPLTVTPAAVGGSMSEFEVPLAALAAGEYIVQIDATGAGGSAQELVAFRVTG